MDSSDFRALAGNPLPAADGIGCRLYAILSTSIWNDPPMIAMSVKATSPERLWKRIMEREKDHGHLPVNGPATGPAATDGKGIGRRAALARLGVAAGVAYVAPALVTLQGAKAQSESGPSGPGWIKPTKPGSPPSKPSK